jgi:hypothetical protein
MMNRLRKAESKLVESYQKEEGNRLAKKILLAPDVFVAVEMMRMNSMFFGRGQFKAIIEILG